MASWQRLIEECEQLLRKHDQATNEGERKVLIAMAARKYREAKARKRMSDTAARP